MKKKTFICLAVFLAAGIGGAFACTTTIVTPGAGENGVCYVTHSDDGHLEADSSIIYVPRAAFDPKGSRPVYPTAIATSEMPEFNSFLVPRIQRDNGPEAYRHPELPRTVAVGHVPYADILAVLGESGRSETYAYLDANYAISNEWGLMFGECTNGSKATLAKPVPNKRAFYSSELARIALEHCKTARDAVRLIGHLIDTYGLWGTGETLPVADAKEGWVIEMAPVPEGYAKAGGLWAAKRVPDGEFFVAANEFRIRELDPAERGKTVMYSDKLYATAKDLGWYTEDTPGSGIIDWLPTVSLGEYAHPYYSLRRVWRALSLAAPSLGLEGWVKDGKGGLTRDYPFSVKPDKPINRDFLIALHRDHYEGTEFDMTKGMAAGPWGNPNRWLGTNDASSDVGDPNAALAGAWERPIGCYYTNITWILENDPSQPRPLNHIAWIALNAPAESCFVPLAPAPVPAVYETSDYRKFNIEGQAWRIYNLVGEYVNLKYNRMMKEVCAAQEANEEGGASIVALARMSLAGQAQSDPDGALAALGKRLGGYAMQVHANWRSLFERIVVNYNQGEMNKAEPGKAPAYGRDRYPDSWLKGTDYYTGPTIYTRKLEL